MNGYKILAAAVIYLCTSGFLSAQDEVVSYSEEGPISIGSTILLDSEVLSEQRKILVSLPESYSFSSKVYPVVYLLDPQDFHQFEYTASVLGALSDIGKIPEMILVGVHSKDRLADMNISPSTNEGGAGKFAEFFETELQPFVGQRYRTAPYSTLIGHSLGGLFALHTLIHSPDVFNAYIAIDPSVSWEEGRIVDELKAALDNRNSFDNHLFTTRANEGDETRSKYNDLIDLLSEEVPDGLYFDHVYLEDETHVSAPMRSIYYGIQSIYEDWVPPDSANSLDVLITHYEDLSDYYGYSINIPLEPSRSIGLTHMNNDNCSKAIPIFEFNIEHNSEEPWTHVDMGWALRRCDRLVESLPHFENAVDVGRERDSEQLTQFIEVRDATRELISEIDN